MFARSRECDLSAPLLRRALWLDEIPSQGRSARQYLGAPRNDRVTP